MPDTRALVHVMDKEVTHSVFQRRHFLEIPHWEQTLWTQMEEEEVSRKGNSLKDDRAVQSC